MAPRIVDKAAKRKAILDAAMAVFARRGMARTTISDIAREAGIGKGTVYEYFTSKEQVFGEAFLHFQHLVDGEIARRTAFLDDPREKLRQMVAASVAVTVEHADFVEITFDAWAESIRRRDHFPHLETMYRTYRRYLAAILDDGIRRGVFRPVDTAMLASAILAALDGLLLQARMFNAEFALDQAAETLLDSLLSGILTGSDPPPAPAATPPTGGSE